MTKAPEGYAPLKVAGKGKGPYEMCKMFSARFFRTKAPPRCASFRALTCQVSQAASDLGG